MGEEYKGVYPGDGLKYKISYKQGEYIWSRELRPTDVKGILADPSKEIKQAYRITTDEGGNIYHEKIENLDDLR